MKAIFIMLMGCLVLGAESASSAESDSDSGSDSDYEEAVEPSSEAAEPSLDERLDALLSEALPAEEYRESSNCLRRTDYRKVDILNGEYLLFSRNNRYWLNRLKTRCAGLRRSQVLTFSSPTSSICRGEQVYVSDRFDLARGFDSAGRPLMFHGTCTLGPFETISVEQAALLRALEP